MAARAQPPSGPSLRKLHLGDGKLGAAAVQDTVWSDPAVGAGVAGAADSEELRAELMSLFAVDQAESPRGAPSALTRSNTVGSAAAKVTLLDAKQSHLKAIGIHALAASLPSADASSAGGICSSAGAPATSTPRGDAELAGALRIVEALSSGSPDALTQDQLLTLIDLLPSEDDLHLVRSFDGPPEALGVVEQFTRACGEVPFCRERASAMLTRAALGERVEGLKRTLRSMRESVRAVRTSAESGALRSILRTALWVYRLVNDDTSACGFRLFALSRFEGYMSADRRVNLLQFLAKRLNDDEEVADLSRLEKR